MIDFRHSCQILLNSSIIVVHNLGGATALFGPCVQVLGCVLIMVSKDQKLLLKAPVESHVN